MQSQLGPLKVSHSSTGIASYRQDVRHAGLSKYRDVTGRDPEVVQKKVLALADQWNAQWATAKARADKKQHIERQKDTARRRTAEAKMALEELETTLHRGLSAAPIDWDRQKNRTPFAEAEPAPPKKPHHPPEPSPDSAEFQPRLGLLDRLVPSRATTKRQAADLNFMAAHDIWIQRLSRADERHRLALKEHERRLAAWQSRRRAFLRAQKEENAALDRVRQTYEEKDPAAVEKYFDTVLGSLTYPVWMPGDSEVSYAIDSETLVVSFSLPPLDDLPRLREVTYVQSRDELNEKVLSDA